jgi:hypothetical protein
MADIEKLLTEAGERWRASQPAVPDLQAPIAQRPVVRPRLGALIVVVALLAVIAFAGMSPVGGPAPSPSHTGIGWDQTQLEAAIVHSGDRVTARGVIIAPSGEAPKLCDPGVDLLMGDPPACLPIAVSVEGVDLDHLPGRTVTKGTISSLGVEVHGTWTGTAIRVESIGASESEPYSLERSACPEPQGGWRSAPNDVAFRVALDPLVAEIAAKPERRCELGWTRCSRSAPVCCAARSRPTSSRPPRRRSTATTSRGSRESRINSTGSGSS